MSDENKERASIQPRNAPRVLLADDNADLREYAQRLLSLDPLNEAGHRALMRLHVATARQDLALRQYEVCRDRLRRELSALQPSN